MTSPVTRFVVAGVVFSFALLLADATIGPFTMNQKAFYADSNLVAFVHPGLDISIISGEIAQDGTIHTVFSINDPKGVGLDRSGVTTPGPVSLSFIAAYLPSDRNEYIDYVTRSATGNVSGTVQQAAAESNGVFTSLGNGQYRYTFTTKAPAGYDATATHTIGIYGSRNLTEFELGTNYASKTFNFVPNGSPATVTHDVIRTQSCNRCHDQLSAHGGSRRGVEMCVLCHTSQTVDPDTGNQLAMNVMVHKIHMGSQLPSVREGNPYRVIGFQGAVHDWSSVVNPADSRRCETCHQQDENIAHANAYLTKPTRVSCGSCHDNVNFATGKNHAGGPQISDNQCATCHLPEGELEFDASIKGAHTVPTDSKMLAGLVFRLEKVDNGAAGQRPIVTFSVNDKSGVAVMPSQLNNLSLVMAGPTTDYGQTSFGPDVRTPGYVSESATRAQCGQDGICVYTFNHAIPVDAKGTFAIGIEGRRTETLLSGTTKEMSVQYGGENKVTYFSVDNSDLAPRRQVVQNANCNQCHVNLSAHGSNRNQVEMCVLCHNPSNTDVARRPTATDHEEREKPPQGVNFNLLVHRIHTGEKLKEAEKSYTVIGFGGTPYDFTEVRFPALSPTGSAGDTRNCALCHVNGSQSASGGVLPVVDPQGLIHPVQSNSSACIGCHVTAPASSHALANTTTIGESCFVCHGPNATFSVSKSHAQY